MEIPDNWGSMNISEKVDWLNENFDHLNDANEIEENRIASSE